MIISCLLAISRVYLARESQEKEIIKSALLTMIFPNGIIVISDLNEWETNNHKGIEWKSVIFHLFEYRNDDKCKCDVLGKLLRISKENKNFSEIFKENSHSFINALLKSFWLVIYHFHHC